KAMSSGARGAARERLDAAKAATLAEREALKTKAREMAGQTPVQPLSLLNAIGEMLPKDAVVIDETISSGAGIRSLLRSDDPQSFSACAAASAGACRRRSASNLRCRSARYRRSLAMAAPCTPARRYGPPRMSARGGVRHPQQQLLSQAAF